MLKVPATGGKEGDLRDPEVTADPGLGVKIVAGGGADAEGRKEWRKKNSG